MRGGAHARSSGAKWGLSVRMPPLALHRLSSHDETANNWHWGIHLRKRRGPSNQQHNLVHASSRWSFHSSWAQSSRPHHHYKHTLVQPRYRRCHVTKAHPPPQHSVGNTDAKENTAHHLHASGPAHGGQLLRADVGFVQPGVPRSWQLEPAALQSFDGTMHSTALCSGWKEHAFVQVV